MKKTKTLKKNYEFKHILNKGKYISANYLECFFLKTKKNINLIGIAISSKFAKANKRNRIKRLIRENYIHLENQLKTGYSMIFLIKKNKNIEDVTYYNIQQDMIKIMKEMNIYLDEQNDHKNN